jgi:hypothetical protein
MEWSEVKSNQVKKLSAVIGASAAAAMGVAGVALSEAPAGPGNFTVLSEPDITTGETVTTTTGQTEIPTSVAEPPVTATTPEGMIPP